MVHSPWSMVGPHASLSTGLPITVDSEACGSPRRGKWIPHVREWTRDFKSQNYHSTRPHRLSTMDYRQPQATLT